MGNVSLPISNKFKNSGAQRRQEPTGPIFIRKEEISMQSNPTSPPDTKLPNAP